MLLRNGATNHGLDTEGFLPTTVVASTMTLGSHWNESSSLDQQLFNAFGGTTILVPPIRDYPNIEVVIQKTFEQAFQIHNRSELSLSVQAREVLRNHLWVGNISEIEGVARHCCAVCSGNEVNVSDLPAIFQDGQANQEDSLILNGHSGISQSTLQSALTHNNWNASKTARFLGISRATLYRKMNEAGIERPDK
jgi:transcriptional regulator of acetoin/glycerol metabolism